MLTNGSVRSKEYLFYCGSSRNVSDQQGLTPKERMEWGNTRRFAIGSSIMSLSVCVCVYTVHVSRVIWEQGTSIEMGERWETGGF